MARSAVSGQETGQAVQRNQPLCKEVEDPYGQGRVRKKSIPEVMTLVQIKQVKASEQFRKAGSTKPLEQCPDMCVSCTFRIKSLAVFTRVDLLLLNERLNSVELQHVTSVVTMINVVNQRVHFQSSWDKGCHPGPANQVLLLLALLLLRYASLPVSSWGAIWTEKVQAWPQPLTATSPSLVYRKNQKSLPLRAVIWVEKVTLYHTH